MTDPKTMTAQERDSRRRQIDGQIIALNQERAELGRSACAEFERDFEIGSCCRYKEYNSGNPFTYAMIVSDHYEDDGLRVPVYLTFKAGIEVEEAHITKYARPIQWMMVADFERITADEFEKGKKAALEAVAILAATKKGTP